MSPDLSSFRSNPTTFHLHNIITDSDSDSDSVGQHNLQKDLQGLIDNARESWTYAIFWQPSIVDDQSRWGDGYYKGETKTTPTPPPFTSSPEEQEYRKTVLQELDSFISGPRNDGPIADEVVTDTEWFFLVSMTHSFVTGNGTLAGRATSSDRQPVWICGQEALLACSCDRARQGEGFGLQTMVCIPTTNGVVEFGSTETVFRNSDLINEVGVLFNSPPDLRTTDGDQAAGGDVVCMV